MCVRVCVCIYIYPSPYGLFKNITYRPSELRSEKRRAWESCTLFGKKVGVNGIRLSQGVRRRCEVRFTSSTQAPRRRGGSRAQAAGRDLGLPGSAFLAERTAETGPCPWPPHAGAHAALARRTGFLSAQQGAQRSAMGAHPFLPPWHTPSRTPRPTVSHLLRGREEDAGEENQWGSWFRKDSGRARAAHTRPFPTGAQT